LIKKLSSDSKKEITKSDNDEISGFNSRSNKDSKDNNEKKIEKKTLNFNELIKSQDFLKETG